MKNLWSGKSQLIDAVYLKGGINSVDLGCPAWGTSDSFYMLSIGDSAGQIRITYSDNTQEDIPLLYGYTMWFREIWQTADAPFSTDETAKKLLDASLALAGVWEKGTCPKSFPSDLSITLTDVLEKDKAYYLKIQLKPVPLERIELIPSPDKTGSPVYELICAEKDGIPVYETDAMNGCNQYRDFLSTHCISAATPVPKENLNKIRHMLYMFPEDYIEPVPLDVPTGYDFASIRFSGSNTASILTNELMHNLRQIKEKVGEDGFFHTSSANAPNWNYFGFGTWTPKLGAYYDKLYSRDGGYAILTLLDYGCRELAEKAMNVFHKWLMYYRENDLKIMGKSIPGHWSVMPNQPLIYSTYLVPEANWATQYTQERFGEGYQNLGNLETDGHGLLMLAAARLWKALGRSQSWLKENFCYIREAAEFIVWQLDNPDVSLSKNGLLYAESEAGMNDYTLYCNLPNYLGLLEYAAMAEESGQEQLAEKWRSYAKKLYDAIDFHLSDADHSKWIQFGFYHDPTPPMFYNICDPLLTKMPPKWRERSIKTYLQESEEMAKKHWFGCSAAGYDHCQMTENALLLDFMEDAERLVDNLAKFCYCPKLELPFIVPESCSYDASCGMIRRQGDLGNLVQQAEFLRVAGLLVGVRFSGETLYIVPRLPKGWQLDSGDLFTGYGGPKCRLQTGCPANGEQKIKITLEKPVESALFRAGPFPPDTTSATAFVNGEKHSLPLSVSGDRKWGILKLPSGSTIYEINITYQ